VTASQNVADPSISSANPGQQHPKDYCDVQYFSTALAMKSYKDTMRFQVIEHARKFNESVSQELDALFRETLDEKIIVQMIEVVMKLKNARQIEAILAVAEWILAFVRWHAGMDSQKLQRGGELINMSDSEMLLVNVDSQFTLPNPASIDCQFEVTMAKTLAIYHAQLIFAVAERSSRFGECGSGPYGKSRSDTMREFELSLKPVDASFIKGFYAALSIGSKQNYKDANMKAELESCEFYQGMYKVYLIFQKRVFVYAFGADLLTSTIVPNVLPVGQNVQFNCMNQDAPGPAVVGPSSGILEHYNCINYPIEGTPRLKIGGSTHGSLADHHLAAQSGVSNRAFTYHEPPYVNPARRNSHFDENYTTPSYAYQAGPPKMEQHSLSRNPNVINTYPLPIHTCMPPPPALTTGTRTGLPLPYLMKLDSAVFTPHVQSEVNQLNPYTG